MPPVSMNEGETTGNYRCSICNRLCFGYLNADHHNRIIHNNEAIMRPIRRVKKPRPPKGAH